MICEKCGKSNAPIKKCCANCWSFLSGMTINNVTGEYGYRGDDGLFYESEQEYHDKKNESKKDNRPKCKKHNVELEFHDIEFNKNGGFKLWLKCPECELLNKDPK